MFQFFQTSQQYHSNIGKHLHDIIFPLTHNQLMDQKTHELLKEKILNQFDWRDSLNFEVDSKMYLFNFDYQFENLMYYFEHFSYLFYISCCFYFEYY